MSKNLKTLICCILALVFVSGTLVAVFADSTGAFKTKEASSEVATDEVASEVESEIVSEKETEPSSEPKTDPTPVVNYGDVNLDGEITAADARLALRAAAKLEKLSEAQLKNADVITDSVIKANDARLILRVSAQLEPKGILGSKEAYDRYYGTDVEIPSAAYTDVA